MDAMDDDLRISPVEDDLHLNDDEHLRTPEGRQAIDTRNRRHFAEYLAELRRHRTEPCAAGPECCGRAITESLVARAFRSRRYGVTMATTAVQMMAEAQDDAAATAFAHRLELDERDAQIAELTDRLAAADQLLADVRPDVRVVEP